MYHCIRKILATDLNRIHVTFGLHHSIEGAVLLRYTNFRPFGSFFIRIKKHCKSYLSSFLKNVEYQVSTSD